MSFRKGLLAATALALPVAAATIPRPASAQPVQGLYIGAGAGVNWLQDADLAATGQFAQALAAAGTNPRGEISFDVGWVGVVSLGWGFGNGLRAEIEGNYRQNEVNKIRGFTGAGPIQADGTARSYGVMGNVFYDLDFSMFGMPSYVQPYLGAGVGYVWREFDDVRASVFGGTVRTDGSDGRFAYQAIAGAGVPFTWIGVPGLTLTAEYRFLGTLEHDIDTESGGGTFAISRGGTKSENYNHSILLGVRYAFYRPPPPAPPAPAPAVAPAPEVARTYLVFFDWDRADLTDRARQIIAEAAQNSRRAQTTRIEVAGHADRSGTPAYNQRLSQRRADNVAAELVRQGVGRDEIVVTAFGESRPLVPTADGVREPQNRRVEIALR